MSWSPTGGSVDTARTTESVPLRTEECSSSTFVGREREVAALRAALHDVNGRRTRIVLLTGEPGIGKTRLADELATGARANGAEVLWGRCWEGDGAPAFWPWMQIIRTYVSSHDAATVGAAMGAGAADIAAIVPEVRAVLPHLPAAEPIDPEAARFRFFDSVTNFLRRASEGQTLVLIFDDLHRADEASLRLLGFLARELSGARLLVVGAYRDTEVGAGHPLTRALSELVATGQCLHLGCLSEGEVGRLVEGVSGHSVSPELVAAVCERTEGNPFFVTEIARLLIWGVLSAGVHSLTPSRR